MNSFLKRSLLLWVAVLLLLPTGCKDLLDLQPDTALSTVTIYTDAASIDAAAAGLYNAAQSGFYDPGNGTNQTRGYPFGAYYVEVGDVKGEDVINTQFFFLAVAEYNTPTTQANVVNYWANLYALINQSNVFIDGVTGATVISDEARQGYIAEGRFMRAISHLELLHHWSYPYDHTPDASHPGVPYRDFPVNTPAAVEQARTQGRNTVAECYTRLMADLDFAEANLPTSRSGNLRVTRATSRAATAFKVRARLHMRDWAGVVAAAAPLVPAGTDPAVIADGTANGALSSTLLGTFSNSSENPEYLLAIENDETDNAGVNGSISSFYTTSSNAGRGILALNPNFFNNFTPWLCDDLRRSELYEFNTHQGAGANAVLTVKYPNASTLSDWTPIVRYAEVVLSVAEAEARLAGLANAPSARALACLNAVRNRALADPATQAYVIGDFANNQELVQAIIDERRIEFLCEGNRWRDIHRLNNENLFLGYTGAPAKPTNSAPTTANYVFFDCGDTRPATPLAPNTVPNLAYTNFSFLWPIPLPEVSQNPTLAAQQNPGY